LPDNTPAPPEPASKNIQAIAALERAALHDRTTMDRVTDAITGVAGSPAFVIGHALFFATWMIVNLTRYAFDPFPFNALSLIVGLEAIFLTGFVLMTQNRMTRQADKRAHLDLQVNLLAEQELTAMLQMLTALCKKAGVPVHAHRAELDEMIRDTDIHTISEALDRELDETRAVDE
jgi:uncharacterized membrane protein